MEIFRTFLLGVLFLLAFMLWTAWKNDHPVAFPEKQQQSSVSTPIPNSDQQVSAHVAPVIQKSVAPPHRLVTVKTDVLNAVIDTLGGNLVKVSLLKYPEEANSSNSQPYLLLNDDSASYYVAQSGLIGKTGPDSQQGQAQYEVRQNTLSNHQQEQIVDLVWTKNKITVHKQFIFKPGSYLVDVRYQIHNDQNTSWQYKLYLQLQRKKVVESRSLFNIASYTGGAISTEDHPYKKISFDAMADKSLNQTSKNGWVAMIQHYFLSAWIPPVEEKFNYYAHADDKAIYTLGMIGNPQIVAPHARAVVKTKLYVGPEIMDNLKQAAPNLDLTVDYGILWFISIGLFWLLSHVYQVVGNWGWSIVIVTILIKLAFYYLSAKSYRSMAAMRKIQPHMQELKERHANDRQKLTQATMELYKSRKINPLSGCLPILIQIPVFIALYWVLLESVELRHSPFIFWIHDLSTKDPYYVLPVLMGVTMFIQQRLNPPPADPAQEKVMLFLPVFFTALFLNFPAGLVLYWVVNNALSILQQWYVTRRVCSQ